MSTRPDFSGLAPSHELITKWFSFNQSTVDRCITAARWGAQYAAEQLADQWPEPITDRPPTETDGDDDGLVQYQTISGNWHICHWSCTFRNPWLHSPQYQPRPPSEAHVIADALRTGDATTAQCLRAAELLESLQ